MRGNMADGLGFFGGGGNCVLRLLSLMATQRVAVFQNIDGGLYLGLYLEDLDAFGNQTIGDGRRRARTR